MSKVLTTFLFLELVNSTFSNSNVLNLEAEFYIDFDDDSSIEVKFYYSRLNNNQYNQSPARVTKISYCTMNQIYYKKYYQKNLQETSNIPQFGPTEKPCSFPKVRISMPAYFIGIFFH